MQVGGLSIERTHIDGRLRVNLGGELDLAAADDLKRVLLQSEDDVRSHEVRDVILDTTDLTFIDSAALSVLIAARQRLGDRLTLIPGRTTVRLLELTGTTQIFDADP